MDNLGSRRPIDLLTEMLELAKPGEEKTQLFTMLFLHCISAKVCILLIEDDRNNLRALAEKADCCSVLLACQVTESSALATAMPADQLVASEEVADCHLFH